MTLDQIVCDSDYPECSRLVATSGTSELNQIADVKGNCQSDIRDCHSIVN